MGKPDEMGYSRKKAKQGGSIFLNPLDFLVLLFYPSTFWNTALTLKIWQNCVTQLGNSKTKNKDPWNFCMDFLEHPWRFYFFFN